MILEFFSLAFDWQQFSTRLALTLFHVLWQGVLVWAVAAGALRLMKNASANARYWAACGALLSLPLLAIATFSTIDVLPTEQGAGLGSTAVAERIIPNANIASDGFASQPLTVENGGEPIGIGQPDDESVPQVADPDVAVAGAPIVADRALSSHAWLFLKPLFPALALLYLAGVALMLLRLFVAGCRGSRLRSRSTIVADKGLLDMVGKLAKQMQVRVAPAVYYCEHVAAPAVIGLVKPAILLPASLLTQLTTDELAAILRHELAHIRRFDLPVQLIQKMIESLFFFHPTAWWLSRQIDDERENCCDDLAAAAGSSQVGYASALLRIAEVCLAKPKAQSNAQTIALSAGGAGSHQITRRIERQLMKDNRFVSPAGRSPLATIAIALGVSVLLISVIGLGGDASDLNSSHQTVANQDDEPIPPNDDYLKDVPAGAVQVELSDRAAVRLIALSKRTDPEQKWWSPDGKPIEIDPDLNRFRKYDSESDLITVLEAVHPGAFPDGDNWAVPYYFTAPLKIKDNVSSKIQAGFGFGEWNLLGQLTAGTKVDQGDFQAKCDKAKQQGDWTNIFCEVQQVPELDFAIVAVGNDGKRRNLYASFNASNDLSSKSLVWKLPQLYFNSSGLSHLEVFTRKRAWAEFEGYALKPNDPDANPVGSLIEGNGLEQNHSSVRGQIQVKNPPKLPPRKVLPNNEPNYGHFPTPEQLAELKGAWVEVDDESLIVGPEGGLANAVVYFAQTPDWYKPTAPPATPAVLSVTNFHTPEPRMLLLRVGQDLVMSNRHDHGSNLNLEPLRSSSAQNRWLKPGEEIRITSPLDRTQPVPFKVKSNVMTIPSYILALDHPFAAVTDAKGRFEINGLPDGKHVFRVWHERTGYLPNIKVNIESGHVNYTTNLSVPGSRFVKKNSDEVKAGEAKGAPVKGNAEKEMQDKKAPQPSTPQVD